MLRWYGDTSRPPPFGISLVVSKSAVWLVSPEGLDLGVSRIDRPTEWEKSPCLETKSLMGQGGTFTAMYLGRNIIMLGSFLTYVPLR